jgi:GDP/UDP-N,N'-diacetylbacillosamine 2-epimerase (hydrolysing)
MIKKKLCIITGSRAEYDLLKPIIKKISKDKFFKLSVIVTGSHLSKKFGFTYKEILKDNIKIEKKLSILGKKDDEKTICKSISKGISKFSNILKRKKYDFILVLGDRYEILSFVISAAFFKIPIIHFSGGEISSGSIDDSVRHAITKFSKYHFVSHQVYKKRVIQLGESPKRVFYVGSTSPENIKKETLLTKKELEKDLNFKFRKENFLVTYHPVTYEKGFGIDNFRVLLQVLKNLKKVGIIFTMPNSDIKNDIFYSEIKKFVKKNDNAKYFTSLGRKKYYSCIAYSDLVIGNSSSGIIEVPSFKKPTLNLGIRQNGRIGAKSIINCKDVSKKNILNSFKKLKSIKFKKNLKIIKNPYEKLNTSKEILKILKKITREGNAEKVFFDKY